MSEAMEGEKKRKREKREYAKRRYDANKERGMERKREKIERYYMGKEDIDWRATPLDSPRLGHWKRSGTELKSTERKIIDKRLKS